jgi:hypothetical protein
MEQPINLKDSTRELMECHLAQAAKRKEQREKLDAGEDQDNGALKARMYDALLGSKR